MKKNGTSKPSVAQRRKLFVEAYFDKGENATQAYLVIAPHVTINTAGVEGHRFLKHPRVQALVIERRAAMARAAQLSNERTLKEVARVAFFDPRKLLKADGKPKLLHEIDEDTAAGLAVELDGAGNVLKVRTVNPSQKNSAVEKAMKHLRLYEEPPAPPPAPAAGEAEIKEAARRMAFMLAMAAGDDQPKRAPKQKPRT